MPDGTLAAAPGQRNRPSVHSEARLVPSAAFLRCQQRLNDPRLIVGPPKRIAASKPCCSCGAPPDWRARIDRPGMDEHAVYDFGDEYASDAL